MLAKIIIQLTSVTMPVIFTKILQSYIQHQPKCCKQ